MTKRLGIREVTRHTSQVIHEAAAGEQIIITEHDRPIAMLVPLPKHGPSHERLVQQGAIIPAANPDGVAALKTIRRGKSRDGKDSTQIISEMREERL